MLRRKLIAWDQDRTTSHLRESTDVKHEGETAMSMLSFVD
jgi:hypothetical protein